MIFSRGHRFSTTVGFIGVGKMGSGMVQNLAKHHRVVAYDTNPNFINDLAKKDNIEVGTTVSAVAKQAQTIITMLPNDVVVSKVCDTLFAELQKVRDSIIIDCSTISPFSAIELNERASKHQIHYVDCPVSGGVGGAAAGTLSFMVGTNSNELYARCEAILSKMGKNLFKCEKPGGGQSAKICNNLALAIEMLGVSEALSLGVRLNLDPQLLSKIINVSSGRCWSSDTYNPVPGVIPTVPSSNNYDGGFTSELMLKDLSIALDAAKRSSHIIPLGKHSHSIYSDLVKRGLQKKDFSIVYQELLHQRLQ